MVTVSTGPSAQTLTLADLCHVLPSLNKVHDDGETMTIKARDDEELQTYAAGMMRGADHHAGRVKGVALVLLDGVIWRGEPDSSRIRLFVRGL